jgi:hypothetical protein
MSTEAYDLFPTYGYDSNADTYAPGSFTPVLSPTQPGLSTVSTTAGTGYQVDSSKAGGNLLIGSPNGGAPVVLTNPGDISQYRSDETQRGVRSAAEIAALIVGGNALASVLARGGAAAASAIPEAGASDAEVSAAFGGASGGGGTAATVSGLAPGLTTGANGLPDALAPALTAGDSAAGGAAASSAAAAAAPAAAAAANPAAVTTAKTTGLLSALKNNSDIIGAILNGLGKGYMVDEENKAQQDLLQKRYDLTSGNYRGVDPSATFRGLAPGQSNVTPDQKFGSSLAGGWQYEYDPKAGKIVRVPVQPTQQQAR